MELFFMFSCFVWFTFLSLTDTFMKKLKDPFKHRFPTHTQHFLDNSSWMLVLSESWDQQF